MNLSPTDNWRAYTTVLRLLAVLWFLCGCTGRATAVDVTSKCYDACGSRLVLEQEDFNIICSEDCRLEKCRDGCDRWHASMSSSCQEICNGTVSFQGKDVFCLMGCNLAISAYLESIKAQVGEPTEPSLVADSATYHTVTIRWVPSPWRNVSYLVQWRYDSLPGDWEYYKPQLPLQTNTVRVDGLHPYTKYRFRIAWILLPNHSPLFSKPSVVISTLPHGVPSTAPRITSLTAISPNSIAVSWDPPSFPNGPISSYLLYLVEHPSGFTMVKDISDVSMGLYFMFSGLRADTLYTVSLATNNNMGLGPNTTRNVTTPADVNSTVSPTPEPSLIIATKSQVLKQDISIMDVPAVIFSTVPDSTEITGVAMHISEGMIFIADSKGSVRSIQFRNTRNMTTLIDGSPHRPGLLSADWLNQKLYMVEDNQISLCDFSGKNYEVVVSGFEERPTDMQVDPYNGYIYWVLQNATGGGLYRIDLGKFGKETVARHEAQLIVKDEDLHAFTVDYRNYRLLLPRKKLNTIVSVSLSGTDESDIRSNSQNRKFTDVRRMAYYMNSLFWTTSSEVVREEYHREGDKFYHTAYPNEERCTYIGVFHASSQLCPVPVNPVRAVEAIFKDDLAKIAWKSPRLLGGLGKGAWQKWLYELQVQDHSTRNIIFRLNITETSATVGNLRPNTVYSVKVRAYSRGGKGPWSSDFIGRTLQTTKTPGYPYMLWSANEALLRSDIVGDNVQPLIHWSTFENAHVTDITWYQGQLFLNTNISVVYTYNVSSRTSQCLHNVSHATAVAVDWLAPKLYWSSPIRQMILRSNLNGTYPESLPLLTLAQEIAVDAPAGFLYWATTHSVECARLNGEDRQAFFQAGLFSGKQVMGLTLDLTHKKVYWMVRSYQGSNLFKASLRTHGNYINSPTEELIGPLPESDMKGPIWYFSNRLYWIHQQKEASISNMLGQNVATLKGSGLHGLRALAIVDPSLHPYPGGLEPSSINVVPGLIPAGGIKVLGTWENFNITWPMESQVNYGKVFYELKITDGKGGTYTKVTNENVFVYPLTHHLQPYTLLEVAVRAYTYWASSRPTTAIIFSPMSVPTAPLQPRVFSSHRTSPFESEIVVRAEFRWAPPKHPNGIISGYRIDCWYFRGQQKVVPYRNVKVGGSSLSYHFKELLPNTTYYFQVGAATETGEGPMSDVVHLSTSEERPVPRLLLAKTDAVKLSDVDCHEEMLLSSKASHPVAVAYLAQDERVFWLEEKGLLVSSGLDGSNITVIHSLPFSGTSLSVDWVGRYLYWTETDRSTKQSSIVRMDLNQGYRLSSVLNSSSPITSVEVDPFSSSLLYTYTTSHGFVTLMTSGTDGSYPRAFFARRSPSGGVSYHRRNRRDHQRSQPCDCDPHATVGNTVTLDRSDKARPRVLWVDGEFGHIWSADLDGCYCSLIVNATDTQNAGLPPASLTADTSHVYWSNFSTGKIYSVDKATYGIITDVSSGRPLVAAHHKRRVTSEDVHGIRGIRAIGEHLQPYPDAVCLLPPEAVELPSLKRASSRELVIQLAEPKRPAVCSKISRASIRYTLFYGPISPGNTWQCKVDMSGCSTLVTYNTTVALRNLQPFTNYSVMVAMSNFYSIGMSPPGQPAVFMTHEGVPSQPTNVAVEVVSPTTIYVQWGPPETPNGHPISYEVRWCQHGFWTSWHSMSHTPREEHTDEYLLSLRHMTPGTEYQVLVRAYSKGGDKHSDSEPVTVAMHNLPANLTMSRVTSHDMDVTWTAPGTPSVVSHCLEHQKAGDSLWQQLTTEPTVPNRTYIFPLRKLLPKTDYNLRMRLTYRSSVNKTFAWPQVGHFTFHTLGDRPDKTKSPSIINLGRDIYQVEWEEVQRNGGEYLVYMLQVKTVNTVSDNSEDGKAQSVRKESDWLTAYNSTNNYWIIRNLEPHSQYIFRVQAMNEYGAGNFSDPSELFVLPDPGAIIDAERDPVRGVIMFIVLGILLFVSVALISLYLVHKRRENDKKSLQANVQDIRADLELATLSELPHHGNFIQQNNALYALGDIPSDEILASLPLIERDQIILTKFLGSGAFGEVFEGIAHDLGGEGQPPTKVAVKTLRKGATDQEKAEFLKEAKLMSNFKHEHILRLLGISLDTSLHFIILELMEGGDLLSYLRNNRPTMTEPSSLTLGDLLSICVDVATGCRYLEDMHFVHRDLAARNCLVSSTDPATRIVKIGDFGLARDIYKHDYYRKEGEGLLPVRWMAPESLVDGVFTNHSDVWAFGVLLWEVMTLGQQPYPARTNLEVLHYVREGGRLDNPECCPDDLHDLMLRCWAYNPEERPDFAFCLDTLQNLRQKYISLTNLMTAVHNHNYIGHTFTGTSKDCNAPEQNSLLSSQEGDSLRSCTGSTTTADQLCDPLRNTRNQALSAIIQRPLLPSYQGRNTRSPQNTNNSSRYLQLLCDGEAAVDADGYEVPLPLPPPHIQQQHSLLYPEPTNESSRETYHPDSDGADRRSDLIGSAKLDAANDGRLSPTVTSALLKSQPVLEIVDKYDPIQTLKEIFSRGGHKGKPVDGWSMSTSSTAPCTPCTSGEDSDPSSHRNSGISSLSAVSGTDLDCAPKVSWC
ncbi:proto-oncogene tyrosine-protein kinase ROS-like isoform X2 [Ornithodoros turicata]|uniref:proto-oncogene tyrosine-protein kinase ROS-like isoform X2 n=1 Tax=Ornithodoros turicata TaxID=34597 RepID=UPI0031398D49